MDKIYKAAVIGGGVAGIIAAIELSAHIGGEQIALLERMPRIGKKLIVTGASQGNLTNANLSTLNYYGEEEGFAEGVLTKTNNVGLEKYLNGLGIYLTEKENGKKYPLSMQASSVLDILRLKLEEYDTQIFTDFFVTELKKEGVFTACAKDGRKIKAEKIILCSGGKASKQFGTDGNGYKLAESFSHTVTDTFPSLVQVKTDLTKIRSLRGLKSKVKATAVIGGKEIKSESGEILFTDYGVSGPAVFQLSGHLAKAGGGYIKVEFLPDLTEERIIEILSERAENAPHLSKEDLLIGLINKQIGRAVVKSAGSDDIVKVAKELKNFTLAVTGTLGFDYAQVTKGGVRTSEVNKDTLESKLVKGLYFAGEILDVDGDCGGYNVQWAMSSGLVAARAIADDKN